MANLTRWDPFGEKLSLRDAINQLFEASFVSPTDFGQDQAFSMPLDLRESDDGFIVDAVVPGVKPEDLNITLENNVLTITGETKQEQQAGAEQGNYHRVERRYGRFTRSIALPTSVNADQVQATLENGILHVQIAKAEEVRPRRITVSSGPAAQPQLVDTQPQGEQSREHGA
jgi:HSP20 family protein